MHAQNNQTAPHTAQRVKLTRYGVSNNQVSMIFSMVDCNSVDKCELSLAIYVQGKNILRKSCIHKNILP